MFHSCDHARVCWNSAHASHRSSDPPSLGRSKSTRRSSAKANFVYDKVANKIDFSKHLPDEDDFDALAVNPGGEPGAVVRQQQGRAGPLREEMFRRRRPLGSKTA